MTIEILIGLFILVYVSVNLCKLSIYDEWIKILKDMKDKL